MESKKGGKSKKSKKGDSKPNKLKREATTLFEMPLKKSKRSAWQRTVEFFAVLALGKEQTKLYFKGKYNYGTMACGVFSLVVVVVLVALAGYGLYQLLSGHMVHVSEQEYVLREGLNTPTLRDLKDQLLRPQIRVTYNAQDFRVGGNYDCGSFSLVINGGVETLKFEQEFTDSVNTVCLFDPFNNEATYAKVLQAFLNLDSRIVHKDPEGGGFRPSLYYQISVVNPANGKVNYLLDYQVTAKFPLCAFDNKTQELAYVLSKYPVQLTQLQNGEVTYNDFNRVAFTDSLGFSRAYAYLREDYQVRVTSQPAQSLQLPTITFALGEPFVFATEYRSMHVVQFLALLGGLLALARVLGVFAMEKVQGWQFERELVRKYVSTPEEEKEEEDDEDEEGKSSRGSLDLTDLDERKETLVYRISYRPPPQEEAAEGSSHGDFLSLALDINRGESHHDRKERTAEASSTVLDPLQEKELMNKKGKHKIDKVTLVRKFFSFETFFKMAQKIEMQAEKIKILEDKLKEL